ncbi:MAG: hypothetical protein OXL96_00260 [Candidatus Poribacteria bacterium]|nr:hypothetical protein [Candidatus Poribacteria bacterium]
MFSRMKRIPFKRIGTGLILLGLLCLTFLIRIQGVDRIPDGQFTGNDAYLYYRQAQTIAEQGSLPARDMDRWLPLGRDNQQLLPLFSYVIAYTHKVFPWFRVYDIQLYSPAVCFTLAIGVLFLLLIRCYGVMFAAIVSVLLATLPGSISRSAAGYGDRDAWYYLIGVLVVTSYLWKEQMDPGRRRWIATALAGFTVFLGGMSWEGFGVFVLMIVAIELYKFCATDTEQHLKEYLLWLVMFVPWLYIISPAYRSGYGFSTHVAALMLFPLLTVAALRGIRYLLLHYAPPLRTQGRKLAWGLTALGITTGVVYILISAGTFAETAYPFDESRLIKDVGELADPHLGYWQRRYGAIFVLGSIGLIVAPLHLWKWKGLPLALSLTLFTATTFFRDPLSDVIGDTLCNTLFIAAFVLTLLSLGFIALRSVGTPKELQKETTKNVLVTLAMLAWFLVWVSLSRGAKRSDLFIGLPLAYGTAWLLYLSPTHLIQWLKDVNIVNLQVSETRAKAIFAVIVLIPILFWTPVGGHATRSIYAAARMKSPTPGEGSETKVLQWMKDTLPENSVIAANWGSGNRINVLGGVKTITDPDHYLPHWIHLYYRHVFCAQSEREALEFLKTHGATHLMLSENGILSNSRSYSFIGSDENSDRMFRIYPLERTETTIGSPYRLLPKRYNTTDTFFFLDIVRKDLERLTVSATFENGTHLSKEIHVSHHHDTQTSLDFQNGGAILYFKHDDAEHNFIFHKAYSVPASGWNSLAVKLYFRGEHSGAFVPVYPVKSDAPPKIKIWEIHYPPNIHPDVKYLKTGFPEIDDHLQIK